MVDTGSTWTVLPDEFLTELWEVSKLQVFAVFVDFGGNGSVTPVPCYDLRGFAADERPAVAFRLDNKEWIFEVADTTDGELFGPKGEGTGQFASSIYPKSLLEGSGYRGRGRIPSVLGHQFWGHLKGLVFDFTPGRERVGLVPRMRLTHKSGLLNPMFVSGASN